MPLMLQQPGAGSGGFHVGKARPNLDLRELSSFSTLICGQSRWHRVQHSQPDFICSSSCEGSSSLSLHVKLLLRRDDGWPTSDLSFGVYA